MKYETKYYVNENKRVVVCVIECHECDALDFFNNCGGGMIMSLPHNWYSEALMPLRFVGVAKCAPDDKFDEHIGRLLAFDRAKTKYVGALVKRVNTLTYHLCTQVADRINMFVEKEAKYSDRRLNEIEDFIDK